MYPSVPKNFSDFKSDPVFIIFQVLKSPKCVVQIKMLPKVAKMMSWEETLACVSAPDTFAIMPQLEELMPYFHA